MNEAEPIITPHNVRDRLLNWAFACRFGMIRHTCGSIEKHYHCPQVWESPQPRRFVDHLDADTVEKAWRTLNMRHKMMLKWAYVYPVHPRVAERKAKVRTGSYDSELRLAEFKIAISLYKTTS